MSTVTHGFGLNSQADGTSMALSVSRLALRYHSARDSSEISVTNDVSFECQHGEFVSVVGPSGCGKSSLLYAIDGLLEPSSIRSGHIKVNGRPVLDGPRPRSGALVFQDASLFPWYTALDNVAFGLRSRRVKKREARARAMEVLDLVGLRGFASSYPRELSGGMQQRVNLARALAVDPTLLLMDEPFSALDAQTREFMQLELTHIWENTGKTALFITHDISEAVYLSDRVLVMSARPATILLDLEVNFERPRLLSIKRSSRFQELVDQVWRLIVGERHDPRSSGATQGNANR